LQVAPAAERIEHALAVGGQQFNGRHGSKHDFNPRTGLD
jgi:hypothetical protein